MLKFAIAGLSLAILCAAPALAQRGTSHAPAGTIGTTPAPVNNAGAAAGNSAAGAMSTNTPGNNVGTGPNGTCLGVGASNAAACNAGNATNVTNAPTPPSQRQPHNP